MIDERVEEYVAFSESTMALGQYTPHVAMTADKNTNGPFVYRELVRSDINRIPNNAMADMSGWIYRKHSGGTNK